MERLATAMPVLAVPLIATALLRGDPIPEADMEAQVNALMSKVPLQNRTSEGAALLPDIERGLRGLRRRGIIHLNEGAWHVLPHRMDVLQFYASSVAHFLPEDAALAKEFAATAGS
jgi:glycerol-3-phosphate O-acyltransferase